MNKCHYYLSNGLWEIVKCYFDANSKLENVYFWAMAVAPHHTCFFSHLVATPWQQSWATLQLLAHCLEKRSQDPKLNVFSLADIAAVKKEVDFQFTLRNHVADPFVQTLFETFGKNGTVEFDTEVSLSQLQDLLTSLLQLCPSTAHCFARQLTIPARLLDSSASTELSLLAIATMTDTPPLPRVISLAEGSSKSELLVLLLANGQTSILRRIEEEHQQKIVENALLDLQQLVHQGIEPKSLFQAMVLNNRHFIIHLLDLMELSPTITQTEKIPKFLWPLLLLKLWGKPDITENQILTLIDQCKESTGDQIILRVCFMLEWYLSFSRWSANQGGGNCVGLEAARERSVLRLIHASADLAEADWCQVRALLHEPWDLQLLDAFCAHILLLRAMTAAAGMRRDRIRFAEAAETERKLAAEYRVEVTERLEQVRVLIRGLNPLRFRLEVLENLFGLLFVTWEDLAKASLRRRSVVDPQNAGGGTARPAGASRGFLCGPQIVKDTVDLIKDCTAELEREPKAEPEVDDVPCSIKLSQMENRLDRLTDALNEASWRLQLVTGADSKPEMIMPTSERDIFEAEWLVDTWQEQGKLKRRVGHEKREESGSQSPASGGETDHSAEPPPGPGFMHQMLSSDWSLVVRCLSQADFLNADHIIKMMSEEEVQQLLEGELNFTQEVCDIRRKLLSQTESPSRKPPMQLIVKSPSSEVGLQLIQQVTAQGISATALTNQIELLLSSGKLPTIQGSSMVTLGSMQNSAATVALDLAITATNTFLDFRDLLSLASKHCPELTSRLQPPLMNADATKPLGNIAFSQILMTILHEINRETPMSVTKFLRSRHMSFSLKILKDQETMWKQLRILGEEVVESRREGDGEKGKRKGMKKILEEASKMTHSSAEILDLGRSETTSDGRHPSYAELVNRYLSDLAAFSVEGVAPKPDSNTPFTFHSLLEMSAVQIVDRLVFKHQVDPAVLEKRAQQLGFNLCASLIWGCCPPIPQGPVALPMPQSLINSSRVMLNKFEINEMKTASDEDTATTVSSILSDLLTSLKEFAGKCDSSCSDFVSAEVLSKAVFEDSILLILKRTAGLANMDFPASATFSFYVNLCNLMYLHAILDFKVQEYLCKADRLIRNAALGFIGYQIGNRMITLEELRTILCGEESQGLFSLHNLTKPTDLFLPDPRCIFLLPGLEPSGPKPKLSVCTTDQSQLPVAVESFAKQFVSLERNRLKIPALLNFYLESVLLLRESETTISGNSTLPARRSGVLLEFLLENAQDSVWIGKIKEWIHRDLIIEVLPSHGEPNICLNYCDHNHTPPLQITSAPKHNQHWESRTLSEPIIKQLSQNSRLLADLVARLHDAKADNSGKGVEMAQDILLEDRLRCLEALLAAPWVQNLAPIFKGNSVLAALHKVPPSEVLWEYLGACAVEKRWLDAWIVVKALPDFLVQNDVNLRRMRDLVLFELAGLFSQNGTEPGWTYSQNIWDIHLRIQSCIVYHSFWPGSVAIKQFSMILLDHPDLSAANVAEIQSAIKNIVVFNSIAEKCKEFESKTWFEIATLSTERPEELLKTLVKENQLQLCLDWVSLPGAAESIVSFVDTSLVVRFATLLPRQLSSFVSRLPSDHALELCKKVINQLRSLQALRSIAELCSQIGNDEEDKKMFKKLCLGVNMLSLLEEDLTPQLIQIATEPLLILEQLLMNTRLDSVTLLLKKLRQLADNELIEEDEVNRVLRKYASRALEVTVIRVDQAAARESFLVPTTDFEIPAQIPEKSQWIPDNQVKTCMCCRLVNFSMFNRRHHCRRCGRVVCATCSPHRIKVDSYEGLPVRVCKNCYAQHSKPEADRTSDRVDSVCSSEDVQLWCLTTDEARNELLREEFSYEHAPNAPLCLAIFNLLPNTPVFTSSLLDESEKLLKLLQARDTAGNPEVDYVVLIQIIRSLIIGAKVRYGQAGLATGILNCDRLLSQVDVISLFVRKHCMRLIPAEPLNHNTQRALRDRLVEEELWDLAIEFSTKAGLPLAGVWATWGKILLAAGAWQEARQKLSQCLSPTASHSRNAPLLEEICRIIEATTFTTSTVTSGNTSDSLEVQEVLASLKGLTAGKSSIPAPGGAGSPQFLEQEWYLTKYGSMAALLRFYFRHEQWNTALTLLIQRQLDPELFIDCLLVPAYRLQAHNRLKNEMMNIDASLESFKRYLAAACVQLQKSHPLKYLHDLQIFMLDYVRGAMTCIQLYQSQGLGFSHQVKQSELLQTALRHLEAEISALNKKTRRLDHVMKLDYKDLNKHMNSIWRQLEMAKFLAAAETSSNSNLTNILARLSWHKNLVPTLFDSEHSRTTLAALCVLAGKNVEEGFGLSFRIIQDFGLDLVNVMTQVGRILGSLKATADVTKLAECIKTSGAEDVQAICDKVLSTAVSAMAQAGYYEGSTLAASIQNPDLRITAHIEIRQLKVAYLQAVQHKRQSLIHKVLEEAEKCGNTHIASYCRTKLGLTSEPGSECSSLASSEIPDS